MAQKKVTTPSTQREKQFYPDTVTVTPSSSTLKTTKEIIKRIQAGKPDVKITYSENQKPVFPGHFTSTDKYRHLKKNVVLCTRTDSYIETFASPGHIIEEPGTIVKTLSHCSNSCEYCYLQRTALRHPFQRVYVNL